MGVVWPKSSAGEGNRRNGVGSGGGGVFVKSPLSSNLSQKRCEYLLNSPHLPQYCVSVPTRVVFREAWFLQVEIV